MINSDQNFFLMKRIKVKKPNLLLNPKENKGFNKQVKNVGQVDWLIKHLDDL